MSRLRCELDGIIRSFGSIFYTFMYLKKEINFVVVVVNSKDRDVLITLDHGNGFLLYIYVGV